jgi:hypothetical protein
MTAYEQLEDLDKHCPTCTCDGHNDLLAALRAITAVYSQSRGTWPERCNCHSGACVECEARAAIAKYDRE